MTDNLNISFGLIQREVAQLRDDLMRLHAEVRSLEAKINFLNHQLDELGSFPKPIGLLSD